MAAITTVKQGDAFPDVEHDVVDENGNSVDLTGAAVVFYMRNARAPSSVKVNGAAGVLVIPNPAKIAFRWATNGSDTDVPGTYEAEFRVTPAGGGDPFRVPTDGYLEVIIAEKVA